MEALDSLLADLIQLTSRNQAEQQSLDFKPDFSFTTASKRLKRGATKKELQSEQRDGEGDESKGQLVRDSSQKSFSQKTEGKVEFLDQKSRELEDALSELTSQLGDLGADLGPSKKGIKDLNKIMSAQRKFVSSMAVPTTRRRNSSVVEEADPNAVCFTCKEKIPGKHVKIEDVGYFHPHHFKCQNRKDDGKECGKMLSIANFQMRNEVLYCVSCFHDRFSPKCGYCNLPIKDSCINAIGKTFHCNHFFCAQCGNPFKYDEEGGLFYMEYEGQAYCEEDYHALFANVCNGCSKPIVGEYLIAIDQNWHRECLKCQECNSTFEGDDKIYEHLGKAFCEKHYYNQLGLICPTCHKPITGKCINALGKRYHENHFECSYCHRGLSPSAFKAHDENPFCMNCYIMLYG